MSMLTEQIKKLRKTADEVKRIKDNNVDWLWRDAITLDDAVKEMREAADTIENLRNRLTEQTCHNDDHSGYGFECSWCGHTRTQSDEIDPTEWLYCPNCGRRVV